MVSLLSSNESGATLVEQAIVLPVLLVMTIAAFELLFLSYIVLTTQFSTARAIRDAVIGPQIFAQSPFDTSGTPYEAFIKDRVIKLAKGLSVDVKASNITVSCVLSSQCTTTAAHPGALVSVKVILPISIPFVGQFNIRSVSVARNEWW